MGYPIENYTLEELNRISPPGKVVPSLFWLLPIGAWNERELYNLKYHFIDKAGTHCHDFGVLLYKDPNEIVKNQSNERLTNSNDLSALTGNISQILPKGTQSPKLKDHLNDGNNRNLVLILSSRYPQPGWGLVYSLNDFHEFEYFLSQSIEKLPIDTKDLFIRASMSHKKWNRIKSNKVFEPDLKSIVKKKDELLVLMSNVNSIINDPRLNKVHEIKDFFNMIKKTDFQEVLSDIKEELISMESQFLSSIFIVNSVQKGYEIDTVNELVDKMLKCDKKEVNTFFQSLSLSELKEALRYLRKISVQPIPGENHVVASEVYLSTSKNRFFEILFDIKKMIDHIRGVLSTELEDARRSYEFELNKSKSELESARSEFHDLLEQTISYSLDYGPILLHGLESLMQTKTRSIAWDHARMIGWKLFSKNINITLDDIRSSVAVKFPSINQQSSHVSGESKITGSLFTDLIHYSVSKNPSISAREATKELIAESLRPSEIKGLLKNPLEVGKHELVEELLVEWGWPAEEKKIEMRLSECVVEEDKRIVLKKFLTANDLRIICESFCKDLIDTLTAKLGYSEDELIELIKNRDKDFQFTGRPSWSKEISDLTVGSGRLLIKVLIELLFPADILNIEGVLKSLSDLDILNKLSHHKENKLIKIEENSEKIALTIKNLLKFTHNLISEMPWHFYPLQRCGSSPVVLSGNAWSHSHKETRQLSIIFWDDSVNEEKLLIWNPNRINPVIPDPIKIKRPGII